MSYMAFEGDWFYWTRKRRNGAVVFSRLLRPQLFLSGEMRKESLWLTSPGGRSYWIKNHCYYLIHYSESWKEAVSRYPCSCFPWHLVLFVQILLLMFRFPVGCCSMHFKVEVGLVSWKYCLTYMACYWRKWEWKNWFSSPCLYKFRTKHLHSFFWFYPSLMSNSKSLHLGKFSRCHTSI